MLTAIGLVIVGLVALYYGADMLVNYAVKLASLLGVPPLIIGLTVVAFGTSAPEMLVNITASLSGNTDIALGNIIGSNIFNVLFILGSSAIIAPLVIHKQLIWWDVPVMIGASLLVWVFGVKGIITEGNGWSFLCLIVIYNIMLIWMAKRGNKKNEFEKEFNIHEPFSWFSISKYSGWIVLSLIVLVAGSKSLVEGSVMLARFFGVSELVISLTIIAAGTSIPEVATSLMAAIKKEQDIAVGNILGSNIFNILAILGISALIAPNGIPVPVSVQSFDIPVMVAVAFVCLPIFFTGHKIYRWEGFILLFYYVMYIVHVVMVAMNYSWLDNFHDAMLYFVIPLTSMTLLISVTRQFIKLR